MYYRRPQFKPRQFPQTPGPAQQAPVTTAPAPQYRPPAQDPQQGAQGGAVGPADYSPQGEDSATPSMRPRWQPSPGRPPVMPGGATGSSSQQDQAYKDQMERMRAKRQGQMAALGAVGA